ncbi:MAG TPA: alpha-ketoacid dehydrogenase subunit beta [Dehalococcoidia bacterium]|nr:alpha-ketoacid dehydrogenase subunit beta [Dehalococcoidia bacterium]
MPVISMREALNQALREEMTRDPNVFVMGEDIGAFEGSYKVTAGLFREFGEKRVIDTPIVEELMVGAGIGAAMLGLRPIVEIMTINFILLAMDQVVNHAAKLGYMFGGGVRVPLTIRTPGGGGQQLTAQHSQSLEVYFAHIPGLKVVAPATPKDAKGMLKAAIRDDNPVLFIENISLYNVRGEVPAEEYLLPLNKAEVKREGTDITLVGHSKGTLLALEAARRLAEEDGIEAEVVDLRSLRPLDRETVLESVKKTSRAVLVEEGWPTYGITAEVSASVMEGAFDYLDAPVVRVGGKEVPMPYSKPLENAVIPSVDGVVQAVRRIFGE